MSDERPTSTSTSQSSSPSPPPSELYAYKLRDDGYDCAVFAVFVDGGVSLYSTVTGTSESQRRRSLASPPPASLLPYATAAEASRPSSTTEFLQQTSHPMQPQIHPMPGSPLTAPFMAPRPHPRAGSGSTLLTPPSRKHSRSDTIASADTPHPALIRIPSEETRVLAQAQAAQNRNGGSGGRGVDLRVGWWYCIGLMSPNICLMLKPCYLLTCLLDMDSKEEKAEIAPDLLRVRLY
ncbi:hypothetical protein BT96DRAFT_988794 [Gymnopus androsaceus JB14]|uniref:Uncharacterized protein n=1 Tax=Gymnopus androsaceus JB14 TaxID=1447944 RepID=A0A6A4I4V0_9AGAR|nr:hypothetical protein BT96DRAFT_988794 [Gymnopus androsaceus JB14]